MAGRPSKPIELLVLEGKKHLTKAEIELRRKKESEIRTKTKYVPSESVIKNKIAVQTFNKLKMLFSEIDFIDGLDEMIINRYCLMTAEIDTLEKLLSQMGGDIEECKDVAERITLYKAMSNAEITVNRMRDMLLKIEDRMFLNPASRMRSIPKKPEEVKPSEEERKFGNV